MRSYDVMKSPTNQECISETGQKFKACTDDMPLQQLYIYGIALAIFI